MMDLTEKLIVDAIEAIGAAVSAALGRARNRLHAAVCPQDVRRTVSEHTGVDPDDAGGVEAGRREDRASRPPASIPT
jgi:hypothetical protein